MIELILPWPPSNNHYYRNVNGKTLISEKGRAYRKAVAEQVLIQRGAKHYTQRISVSIDAYVPDNRRRDLDNMFKGPLDAMMNAGVFEDDSQIEKLKIKRMPIGGMLKVKIEVME